MKDIVQFSMDVERNTTDGRMITEDLIRNALDAYGISCVGISYCASWREDDYWEGKAPYDSI